MLKSLSTARLPKVLPLQRRGLKTGTGASSVEILDARQIASLQKAAPEGIKAKLIKCCYWTCQGLAQSPYFSACTTLLTFYALFGDDMRLLLTDRPADIYFDCATLATMLIFVIEIFVCSFGKAGYLLGFFFFLDIISTVTLVLDITFVSEFLFGDSVSQDSDAQSASGAGAGNDDSADAARAARMSRAGTKAGRVVRLIRLMRLIRLVKLFKKNRSSTNIMELGPGPGDEWDDEDINLNVNESAVSKKLSEMTTRRVIILVLSILLILPFFQADMYKDSLPSSAQYGIDSLYRRFREDMVKYDPAASEEKSRAYLASLDRENYVNDFLLYTYFHNWFCDEIPSDKAESPETSFGKLFWVGGSPTEASEAVFFLPDSVGMGAGSTTGGASSATGASTVSNGGTSGAAATGDWNQYWNGKDWALYLCDLPPAAQAALRTPWKDTATCMSGSIRGVSIIESEDARVKCPRDLRFQERIVVSPMVMSMEESSMFVFMFVFDRRSGSQMEAALNSAQTLFICLLLGLGAMTFSNDANNLVLAPIERMITKLDKIRANPIAAMTIGEEEAAKEQMEQLRGRHSLMGVISGLPTFEAEDERPSRCGRLRRMLCCRRISPENAPEPMETVVLEKTIIKIGSLLALGFGEAGAEVIGENMKGNESSVLNAMIPGKRVDAIFGYCDIRNFSDATEVLEDQVMVFVNRIAGVVHSCINEFFGSPNQNVGDAFLLVWRLSGHEPNKQQRLADCATISFMKIIALISKSSVLAEYRSHPRLVKRLPNYRVRMGFGLHTGWAIEGAIGSEFKIDASYLSPNVNMASRLQTFTKVYGNSIIISEMLVGLMTEPVSKLCRLIDRVVLLDTEPLKLYTIDVDDLALEVDEPPRAPTSRREKFRQRYERQKRKNERWADNFSMETFLKTDVDIKLMRKKYSKDFFQKFSQAFLNYESGNWEIAVTMLEETHFLNMVEDGPSAALLRFMKTYSTLGDVAPPDWRGYRMCLNV